MKVLVIYFSQSGNTEKIASAIYDQALQSHETVIEKIDEVDPASLCEYDHVFVGSPIHARSIAKEVKAFFSKLPSLPNVKLSGFITHAAPVYPQQEIEAMCQPFVDVCIDKGMTFTGCFDCQGYLTDFMHDTVRKMQKVDNNAWAEKVAQMKGHPDADDEVAARAFVKSVL